jgi:hypothetical protein
METAYDLVEPDDASLGCEMSGMPHKGWLCDDIRDRGPGEYIQCAWCGYEQVRFIHVMRHEAVTRRFEVGCVCAGLMEENPKAAKKRDRKIRNIASRRARWLSRKWKKSRKGTQYLKTDGFTMGVYNFGEQYTFWVKGWFSKKRFKTEEEAKLALFDAWEGRMQRVAEECSSNL